MTTGGLRVLVCGGRDFDDRLTIYNELDLLVINRGNIALLIHGGCRGADQMADEWARMRGVEVREFAITKGDWDEQGKAAFPLLNQRMVTEGKPNLVVCFPGGKGTSDMRKRAEDAGVEVLRVDPLRIAQNRPLYGYDEKHGLWHRVDWSDRYAKRCVGVCMELFPRTDECTNSPPPERICRACLAVSARNSVDREIARARVSAGGKGRRRTVT